MSETKCGFDDGQGFKGRDLLVSHGPTIGVDIGFDRAFDPKSAAIPKAGITNVLALVDTGATESCIDIDLATKLQLPVTDRRQLAGAGGLHTADVYLAQIHVPALSFTVYGSFMGVNLAVGGLPHRVLLGRTFLQNFNMNYDGFSGTVTISNNSQPAKNPVVQFLRGKGFMR